jgi:hypothetical protein
MWRIAALSRLKLNSIQCDFSHPSIDQQLISSLSKNDVRLICIAVFDTIRSYAKRVRERWRMNIYCIFEHESGLAAEIYRSIDIGLIWWSKWSEGWSKKTFAKRNLRMMRMLPRMMFFFSFLLILLYWTQLTLRGSNLRGAHKALIYIFCADGAKGFSN